MITARRMAAPEATGGPTVDRARRTARVRARKPLNVLVVRGDGRPILKLQLSRSTLAATLGLATLTGIVVATSLSTFYRDYLAFREQHRNIAPLLSRLASQQALIALYDTRVQEVWAEVESWRTLHAKIWEPFGPASGSGKRTTGIGGRSAASPFRTPGGPGDVTDDLARLASAVRQEGDDLRSLERFVSRANKILASLPSRWPLRGPVNSEFGKRLSPWAPNSE